MTHMTYRFPFKSALSFILASSLVLNLVLSSGVALAEPITDLTPSPSVVESVRRNRDTTLPALPDLSSTAGSSSTGLDQRTLNNALFLLQIQNDLKKSYQEYRDIGSTITNSQAKVSTIHETVATLREEVISFQSEIDLSQEKIRNVGEQIGLKEKELSLLRDEVQHRSEALDGQKNMLADYMRLLSINEDRFRSDAGDELFSSAKLLLADQSVADTLNDMRTLDMLQHGGQTLLTQLDQSQKVILEIQSLLLEKKHGLDALKLRLINEQQRLQDAQIAKAKLLEVTHGEQQTYEKLIEDSQKQEDESLLQIRALQDNFNYVKDNLGRLGNSIEDGGLQKLLDERTRQLYDFQQQEDKNATLQWPVKPSRGISAYFHDGAYQVHFGVAHQAIDIPIGQGSDVHAPADGIVYRTKDNGMGYSYIILSHKNKIMTVYGHISSILVKEGQFIHSGDIIGLSGAMPGTKGAGYMTTGPHLHFEVLKNGEHVDPLDYLSLVQLPLDNLPEKYTRRLNEQRLQAQLFTNDPSNMSSSDSSNDHSNDPLTPDKTPANIDASVEQTSRDEADIYARVFGIPKDSATMKP